MTVKGMRSKVLSDGTYPSVPLRTHRSRGSNSEGCLKTVRLVSCLVVTICAYCVLTERSCAEDAKGNVKEEVAVPRCLIRTFHRKGSIQMAHRRITSLVRDLMFRR